MSTPYRKKLIEVSLPLEAINAACAREKSLRHGHPSTLHLWWARRPLAAARAVLFAQLVDDPSSWPELFSTEEQQNRERQRLFRLIEDLVQWENSNEPAVINAARLEIARSHARASPSKRAAAFIASDTTPTKVNEYLATELPPIHDPFAGGGTIPLEAQRLGLKAIATDLNPVAVLISKALIEIPPKFHSEPPINPEAHPRTLGSWTGAEGLASDVRYYGLWLRDQARGSIGGNYPEAVLPTRYGGGKAAVIAWLWARTVESPDPAMGGTHVPLISSFWLSKRPGAEAWIEIVVDRVARTWTPEIRHGMPSDAAAVEAGTKTGRSTFKCVLSGTPILAEYIRNEGTSGRIRERLLAVVAEAKQGRAYVEPTADHARAAEVAAPAEVPDSEFAKNSRHMTPAGYGLHTFGRLFTTRQLVALTTLCELLEAVRSKVKKDFSANRFSGERDCEGAQYADAVCVYLGLAIGKQADNGSSLCSWHSGASHLKIRATFGRQALPMVWDFAEGNPFSESSGNFGRQVTLISEVLSALPRLPVQEGHAEQLNAAKLEGRGGREVVSTDPPYYDNVPYADLADFFYVWLRKALKPIVPSLFGTLATPKAEELVADPFRFAGSKRDAQQFFETGIAETFTRLRVAQVSASPLTVYYAFKQSESADDAAPSKGASSTGWESMLTGLMTSGFEVCGTWPVRTELANRMRGMDSNALASSVVLVCRGRAEDAPSMTRGEFRRALRGELPDAMKKLQQGNIAPVDVAQASIGPGMAIFSRHRQVLEADGGAMTVKAALQLINEVLDEYLASGEGDFDPDTRFAITWYEQHGWEPGGYGEAHTLATARNVSVEGVVSAGICHSGAGKVRILKRPEMRPLEYEPATDDRPTIWEFTQHMIRLLETEGEESAARLLKKLGAAADATRELAYRLYNTCERKKWAEDARSYNGLILAWPELEKLSAKVRDDEPPPEKLTKKGGKKAKAPKKGQQKLFSGDDE